MLEKTMFKMFFPVWLAALPALAQSSAPVAFEVATIKPAHLPTPGDVMARKMHIGMNVDGARVDIGAMSLADLIRIAYKIQSYQINGPDWIKTERFDILGKIPEGVSKDKVPEMLQALLAERFGLKFHRESQEHPIYALIVGKGGPKLKEAPPDDPAPSPAADDKKSGMTIGTEKGPVTVTNDSKGVVVKGNAMGTMRMRMADGKMVMEASKVSMTALTEMLSRFVDRPVIDYTELKGNYQVTLELSMDDLRAMARSQGMILPAGPPAGGGPGGGAPAEAASEPSGGSIFHAVEQLGLKLDPRKAAVDSLMIDHIEKTPTEN
jgi:uncharacterized protein (TIGR03435 family)